AGGKQLQPPRALSKKRGQPGSGVYPERGPHGNDERDRLGIPRYDARMRALPRSQIRSSAAEGLLPHSGLLRDHAVPRRRTRVARRKKGVGAEDSRSEKGNLGAEEETEDPRRRREGGSGSDRRREGKNHARAPSVVADGGGQCGEIPPGTRAG